MVRYTFKIPLPPLLFDGQLHLLSVRELSTGRVCGGSQLTFQYTVKIVGEVIGLDGAAICGWGMDEKSPHEPLTVKLLEGDQEIAVAIANLPQSAKGNVGFRLPLTADFFDGRPHLFSVIAAPSGFLIGQTAVIVPFMITPWHALQKYAGDPLPAFLAPTAHFRYQALLAHLATLSQQVGLHKLAPGAVNDEDNLDSRLPISQIEQMMQLSQLHHQILHGFEKRKTLEPMKVPKVVNPRVSIIIPVHNKCAVTYNCLAALLFAHNQASFEIIIVDDGSTDETLELPELIPNVTYVRHESAQGFIRACNHGSQYVQGEFVVFLNNDTEVTVGWLDEMLFVFESFENVGLVGAKLLYPDGRLQEAGGIVWGTGDPWNYGRLGNPQDPKYNYTRQVDYLSGAAIMVRQEVWQQLGGFDEAYCPAYYEDTDLAFRVRSLGLKVVYAPFSQVIHFEGLSSGTSTASGIKRYQEINKPKFKSRWFNAYRWNGEVGKDVDLQKDRGIDRRALFIDSQVPCPDQDAGSYAAIQEMRLIQSLGFKVTFIAESCAYLGNYTKNLQKIGVEYLHAPFFSSVNEVLERRGREFDVIYITRYNVAEKYLKTVKMYAPQAKILFCNADLHFLRELRMAIAQGDDSLLKKAIQTREIELAIMRDVDVTLSYNETEHAVIQSHNLGQSCIAKCPWVVDVIPQVPSFEKRQDIAFLGGFGHPPNISAVKFFVQEVMPLLHRHLPDLRFLIYGSKVTAEIEALQSDTVIIKGFVQDVAEAYNSCRVFVAPLQIGAGIKGKVIDALAYGVPTVMTPIAAEGTGIRHGIEAMIVDEPQRWAEAVMELYSNQVRWQAMSTAAQTFAQVQFSFEVGRSLMRKALEMADIFVSEDMQSLSLNRCQI
ncbi:glycosyltransferase [Neosynechococcus sphagnicola]|uniref:glycosyltransferase n=1 Tax=Neosynechococcus sphagnicola TaxID=1501145 RepID=UPI0006920CEA|nr:glycosyltransferase [Neosynechococcus sphagnicola]